VSGDRETERERGGRQRERERERKRRGNTVQDMRIVHPGFLISFRLKTGKTAEASKLRN
jgi:hypothetical protein